MMNFSMQYATGFTSKAQNYSIHISKGLCFNPSKTVRLDQIDLVYKMLFIIFGVKTADSTEKLMGSEVRKLRLMSVRQCT